MSIQIVDNFEVGISKSIDNRLVVGPSQFYTDKDDIVYKYAGMRVWDLNAGLPYVWTGTTYSTEAASSVSGSGTPNYISKFVAPGNVIQNSIIYDNGTNVGVGTTSPTKKLHVNGNVQSDGAGGFYGIGTNLTALNATNITTGTLGLARLQNGTSTYILVAGGGSPTWTNPSSITVGNSTNTVNIYHQTDTTTTSQRKILFIDSTGASGNVGVRTASGLSYKPSDSTLFITGGLGIGGSAGSYKLYVTGGDTRLSNYVAINTTPGSPYRLRIAGKLRLENNTSNAFEIGYNASSSNIIVDTYSNSTRLRFNNSGTIAEVTDFTQFSTYFAMNTTSRTYFNVNNSGERLLTFGRAGANDQINFYMDNSTLNVPTVGGKGVYIAYNLRVNQNVSIGANLTLDRSDNTNYSMNISNGGGSAKCLRITAGSQNSSSVVWIFAEDYNGYTSPDYFIVRGDAEVNADAFINLSDVRTKENIKTIEYDANIIKSLRPVTYNKISDKEKLTRAGFIAQEVEEILPLAVRTSEHPDHEEEGYSGLREIKHLDYIKLIPYIVSELQEKDRIISDLEKRIKDLES